LVAKYLKINKFKEALNVRLDYEYEYKNLTKYRSKNKSYGFFK